MSQSSQPSQPETANHTGQCPVCHRTGLTIVKTTGRLWRHGPSDNPCDGRGRLPVPGTIKLASIPSSQGTTTTQPVNDPLVDLLDTPSVQQPHPLVLHPSRNAPIIKHIPKGSRPQAAALLTRLILEVVNDVNQQQAWEKLLNFAHVCFARPVRGGRTRNLTTLITRQIQCFDSGIDKLNEYRANVSRLSKKSKSDDEIAAIRASAKLEDADIKGALRQLASCDALAPQTSTLLRPYNV